MTLKVEPNLFAERCDGEEGSQYAVWVYSRREVELVLGQALPDSATLENDHAVYTDARELLLDALDRLGHDPDGWRAACAGRSFSSGATIRIVRGRVIVRQSVHLDI